MQTHRLRVRLAFVLSAGVLAFGLGACSSTCKTNGCCSSCERCSCPAEDRAGQIIGEWVLLAVKGREIGGGQADFRPPTLRVDADGRISGFAGVNRYHGGVDAGALARGEFKPGPIGLTMMAGPPEAMDLEQRVFTSLESAKRFKVVNTEDSGTPMLELIDEAGVVVMSFRRVIE